MASDTQEATTKMKAAVLAQTNALLDKMGFGARRFESFDDLVVSVSSMSVALYETLFQFRLDHIIRVPQSAEDYESNAQCVVDALSGAILEQSAVDSVAKDDENEDDQLTAKKLCAGNVQSIARLVRMFEQIYAILLGGKDDDSVDAEMENNMSRQKKVTSRQQEASRRGSSRSGKKLTKKVKKRVEISREESEASVYESIGRVRSSGASSSTRKSRSSAESTSHRKAGVPLVSSGKQEEIRAGKVPVKANVVHQSTTASSPSAMVTRNLYESFTKVGESTAKNKRSRRGRWTQTNLDVSKQSIRSRNEEDEEEALELEKQLLATQKYGRFVPAPNTPQESDDDEKNEENDVEEETTPPKAGEEMYFGGVSSVSHASETSVHYMEEEGDFAQNFSQSNSEKSFKMNKSAGTSADDDDQFSGDDRAKKERALNMNNQDMSHAKSNNQKEAELDDAGDKATCSPVKKKVARTEPNAPEKSTSARAKKRDPAKALYPLLPGSIRQMPSSNSRREYLRYKMTLKDHLQELRQREYCQRQHMERAYKIDEHAANVEKIRSRRFEQDIRLHRIAIGLEAKKEEERHLRDAMNHLLQLEKEKLREEQRTMTSILKQIQKEHAEREQAMETFYSNQIQLVRERTHREVKERELVEKAHRLASEQMMRELRRDREQQVAALIQEKQHLEEARRFRHASHLTQMLERGDEQSHGRVDAFYAAAMTARQRRAQKKTTTTTASARQQRIEAAYTGKTQRRSAPLLKRMP